MNEEIKEVLDKLKYIKNNPLINGEYDEENYLYSEEAKLLLNYITNLQQENEKLKENQSGFTLEDYTRLLNNYQELQKEHKNCTRKHWQEKCGEHHAKELIYKSRCEKANKWVDKHTEIYTKNGISIIDWDNLSDPRKLKNILNGSDENE